jgi:hypothetical protein
VIAAEMIAAPRSICRFSSSARFEVTKLDASTGANGDEMN